MKIVYTIIAASVMIFCSSILMSKAIESRNQAYAVVEVAKQETQQTDIEWKGRVEIAEIEAGRDVSIAEFEMWASPAWNVGSIIRGLMWVLLCVLILFLFVGGLKLGGLI